LRLDPSCAKIKCVSQKTPKKKNYIPEPKIPDNIQDRYQTIVEVISGMTSVSEGARRLNLSRNHFQTLVHKTQEAMIDAVTPKPAGRPARSEELVEIEKSSRHLEKENAELQERVETITRLLGVAGNLLKGRELTNPRSSKTKSRSKSTGSGDVEEPDKCAKRILAEVHILRCAQIPMSMIAVVVGVPTATLQRWLHRERDGELIARGRGKRSQEHSLPPPEVVDKATSLVNETRGLIGADALRKKVPELTRTQAKRIKSTTLTERERARKERAASVSIAQPGVVRAIDGVYARTTRGMYVALIAADGAVPFRTSVHVTAHYDEHAVLLALMRDFERHGAPLVLRLDRASCHRTPKIRELLKSFGVHALHGPPRHPQFYGQLERQNRDHRDWLNDAGIIDPEALVVECTTMIEVLNTTWPRRALGWRTPADCWNARPPLAVDRKIFSEEVDEELRLLLATGRAQCRHEGSAERIAIERVLTRHNYLRCEWARRC
jgi:transposase InsO family protein/transposase